MCVPDDVGPDFGVSAASVLRIRQDSHAKSKTALKWFFALSNTHTHTLTHTHTHTHTHSHTNRDSFDWYLCEILFKRLKRTLLLHVSVMEHCQSQMNIKRIMNNSFKL